MNVRILDEAERDLIDGFRFYEVQDTGLESTSWTPSSPTSTPFASTPVSIPFTSATTVFSRNGFPSLSTTRSKGNPSTYWLSWIAAKMRRRSQLG